MPACMRALNAISLHLGLGKLIDDLKLTTEDIDNLSKIYLQLRSSSRAFIYGKHQDFARAYEFYQAHLSEEPNADHTFVRDMLGTHYWEFLQSTKETQPRAEVEAFLGLLTDKSNNIPLERKEIIARAIEGLTNELSSREKVQNETKNSSLTK